MSRLRDVLVLIGVACAVSGSSFVLGQAQDVALPPPPAVVPPRPAEKKKKNLPRRTPRRSKAESKQSLPRKRRWPESRGLMQGARVCGQPAAAALDAQAAQYVQQFRPMFRAEYYFIRNTCGLNTDQRKQLARLGETAVKAAARQFVEAQQKMMRGGWRPGTDYPDPRKLVEQELARVTSPLLSHDQAEPVQGTSWRSEPPAESRSSSITWSRSSTGTWS